MEGKELKQPDGEAKANQRCVALMPFLRLKHGYTIAGVEFLPLRDESGAVPQVLESAAASVDRILSGYVDHQGKPFTNCVVATLPGKGWNLADDDSSSVGQAASLLFLASWASNQYFPRYAGPYVNSTNFRVVWQRFTGPSPTSIAVRARRRDGSQWTGGYQHGELTFNLPIHCSIRDYADVDDDFLNALDDADAGQARTIDRLRTALPFVLLANTDDEVMLELSEAILMASAFEQLLGSKDGKYRLSKIFGDLFAQFGRALVSDACATRRQDTDLEWWIHRKWIKELYELRNKAAHQGTDTSRMWGWNSFEHLVMAAHVFPLTVKLLLVQDGYYQLSDDDRIGCLAVDRLLSSTRWVEGSWTKITSKVKCELGWKRTREAVREKHPNVQAPAKRLP